jgi:inositol phosphorylceramide mannosyltransferase catalytic subunit
MQPPIPKRIIQTGKHRQPPLAHRAAIANLTLLNPAFTHEYFDNARVDEFIRAEFPQYLGVFQSFEFPIQRYDFFRYLAVYRLGGFYFDLDVFLASPLDPLLPTGCVFPFEGLTFSPYLRRRYDMDWQIGNYAFGAAAGHPFLERVIENCVRAQRDAEWVAPMMKGMPPLSLGQFRVLNTTGPGLLSRTYAEEPALAATVKVLFPEDVCDVATWNLFGDFGIHLMDGSWRPDGGGFLRRRLALRWEDWLMRKLIKESGKRGKIRDVSAPGRAAHGAAADSTRFA